MKHIHKMESVILTITGILCTILLLKLFYKLRSSVPWRVNCWFCNSNFWMKFLARNSWICPKCEQYNGFTKDGDYNKPLVIAGEQRIKTPKVFQKSPPKNGLCKMCNINQQLKVTQLANFIPMNEQKFEDEIELYKIQLEKAYKLCSPCKKVVQMKLHKEKEILLGSKLVENRSPEKKNQREKKQNELLNNLITNISMIISALLIILISFEFYKTVVKHKNLSITISNLVEICIGIFERITSIVKMKMILTFPYIEHYLYDINNFIQFDKLPKSFNFKSIELDHANSLTQIALGGFVCFIQIIGHICYPNNLKDTIFIDMLWSIFVIMSIAHDVVAIDPVLITLFKLSSVLTVFLIYKKMKRKTTKAISKIPSTAKKINKLNSKTLTSHYEDDDPFVLDTDDDVSLSKFGLHNFTDSSNETISPLNGSLMNGRCFTPRNDTLWTKPKLNSTFCVNSVLSKSPSSVSDTVFVKPSFNKYQKLVKDDSDSELDESISSLRIGSAKKSKKTNESIFSLRKFTATPNFVTPTPLNRARPLISPSKLGHSTSWVAGGYWGTEGERQIFNINGSRSSSQSSGFESQTSSMNQRNAFSHPPSREESICGEPDRASMVFDRFQNCNIGTYGNYSTAQNLSRVSSPVFPQMQYNSHVHIPQARFTPQPVPSHNVFGQQFVQTGVFKAPGGSGLIKLPQANTFTSH